MLVGRMLALVCLLASAEPDPKIVVEGLLARMESAEREVRDYKATFVRQERVRGTWREREMMSMQWRRPGDLHMKWIGDNAMGRELLWRPHWPKMKLRKGPLTLDLALANWFVARESRHSIRDAGLSALVHLILADAARARRWGSVVTLLPARKVHGAPSSCWHAVQDKAAHPEFYSARAEICVDDATGLPNFCKVWMHEDGELRVVEEYSYANVKLNVGLTEPDFTPATHRL